MNIIDNNIWQLQTTWIKCLYCLIWRIYLAAGFGFAGAFFVAGFGFDAFLAAGFFVPVGFGFVVVVVVDFLTFGLAAFFVEVFFAPVDLAAAGFFALVCFGFVVVLVVADFGFELLAILTFFGLAAAVVVDDVVVAAGAAAAGVAGVLAAVATFLAGFVPADFERARFFVADGFFVDDDFFVFVDFFFIDLTFPSVANLNEPLAPLPFVCLKCFDLTPFFKS